MTTDFKYDVFISYSSKDKDWVRDELLNRIEQAGLKAFIDFRDFIPGAPSIKECERGVLECRKTLLVLTPDYISSGWTEIENIMVQTLDPANRELRLIPLLRIGCEKPLRIGALTHINFTEGADLNLAWRQLLTALGAPPEPLPIIAPERDNWFLAHPYPMPPDFTGRITERQMLTKWLEGDAAHPLLVIRALGGFGKSALSWHWLMNDVKPVAWPRVVWWSFYEGDASFDNFLVRTNEYLSGKQINSQSLSAREHLELIIRFLHQPSILLVLDGFERVLRAFGGLDAAYKGDEVDKPQANDRDCISPLAETFLYHLALQPNLRSKVLMTTRLCPHILEVRGGGLLQGCREEELLQMLPDDAVKYFHIRGIRGTHTEIEKACWNYGFHPLSLRLLAGFILGDFRQPGDIAAAKRLDVSGDLLQRKHHVLEVSYNSLTPEQKKLLSRIACFRSPVKYEVLEKLAETDKNSSTTLDADLHDIVTRGLLHHDTKEGKFDLHPIVRRYAYDKLTTAGRTSAHSQLRNYLAAIPQPEKVIKIEDIVPVIELYHHTLSAGQYDEARILFRDRISNITFYQLGAYQLEIELLRALFPDGEDHPPRLKEESAQAWTLNALANSYCLNGQPRNAIPLYEQQKSIREKQSDEGKKGLAIGLCNLGVTQLPIGALKDAEANLRRSITLTLCLEIKDEFNEAIGYQELGRLLAYQGAYEEAEKELAIAHRLFEEQNHTQMLGMNSAYQVLRELLQLRSTLQSAIPSQTEYKQHAQTAIDLAQCAFELADEDARTRYPHERDYVHAHWLLGAAFCTAGNFAKAETHLQQALERCRRINLVEMEADILIVMARLCAATNKADEAQRLVDEALLITERSGYVMQGADAHLELAKLALARDDKKAALKHAQEARRLATCDGPPDYTYKAAYDEAGALLKQLGQKT